MNLIVAAAQMNDSRGQTEERVYLYPGTLWVGQAPAVVTTVLGSCVAVCLWSETAAGINHFILPRGGNAPSVRYGNHALPILLERVLEIGGGRKENLYAAIFGGASVLGRGATGHVESTLGRRNLMQAREFLVEQQIPILREDVGGVEGRKLTFRTLDGTTIVRKI